MLLWNIVITLLCMALIATVAVLVWLYADQGRELRHKRWQLAEANRQLAAYRQLTDGDIDLLLSHDTGEY